LGAPIRPRRRDFSRRPWPFVGSGVYVEGEARLKTRRLVAKKVEPARLWDDPS